MNALHPRIRVKWVLGKLALAAVGAAVLLGLDRVVAAVSLPGWVPAAVGVLLGLLGVLHSIERYRRWGFEVQADALYLERGVLTRVRTVVPFVRIQHVDTSRGPAERGTGLATCVVYTAGSRGADVAIPGLAADDAEDLQHRLKRLAIASEADTSV